jgi:hypothetical protein
VKGAEAKSMDAAEAIVRSRIVSSIHFVLGRTWPSATREQKQIPGIHAGPD